MKQSGLYETIERIASLLRAEERRVGQLYGLLPVQMQALHYLSRCNRYSNTPAGVTDFLGSTKGTVSQTLLLLERKGCIVKQPDAADGRVVHLVLTAHGKVLLDELLPPPLFVQASQRLSSDGLESLEGTLTEFLRVLQWSNDSRTFGVCQTCQFFQRGEQGYRCGLTHEALTQADSVRICREHESVAD